MRLRSLLPVLCLGLALSACAPRVARVRVDFHVLADGSCTVNAQPVACAEAGPVVAAALGGAEDINAVLMVSPQAPQAPFQALRASLLKAHIGHMQYGDASHMSFEHKPPVDI